jgi:ribosomal protein S18 acetylase RimI-like enzyme|tara:strand:+ start:5083 stop:5811 length:729 start_codon:yes stop_codon:yes gene_type:complete
LPKSFKETTDLKIALGWAREQLGEINGANLFISEVNAQDFVRAFKSEGSFSFTMGSTFIYGQAYGPNPHIDPHWDKCGVAFNSFGPKLGHLEIANQFDTYGIRTQIIAGFESIEELQDETLIKNILESDAPNSSVYPGNPEIIQWGCVRNQGGDVTTIGALVRWSSGAHVISSVATLESERGKGYATELMKRFISRASELGIQTLSLGVSHSNTAAIKAYKRAGMVEIAQFTNYLKPGFKSK